MKARSLNLVLIAFILLLALPQAGQVRAAAASPRPGAANPLLPPVEGRQPGNVVPASGYSVYLPYVTASQNCYTGQSYGSFPTAGGYDGIPAAQHPDKNLAVRGYVLDTTDGVGISSVGLGAQGVGAQSFDPTAPQLNYLFSPSFLPTSAAHDYKVYDWLWYASGGSPPYGNRNGLLAGVTMIGVTTTIGTPVHLPTRMPHGTGIVAHYNNTDYYAMVVYADATRITVVYISYDNIVVPPGHPSAGNGYAVHIENFCTDPNLLSLYNADNAAGRGSLPGLTYNQAMGVASSSEVDVAIVDSGSFKDPRTKAEWWHY